jgi:hypothetical protein
MRKPLLFILTLVAFASDVRAQDACIPIDRLFTERLPRLVGKQWIGHQLKRDGQVWRLIFTQKVADTKTPARIWVMATRHSAERPDVYCIEGVGLRVDVLASLNDSNFDDRFGLPGSNYPRCGKRDDPLEGLKVRAWASRELGESLILSLGDAKSGGATYVLLMSKTDDYWILLQKRVTESTCYRDRGNAHDVREIELK